MNKIVICHIIFKLDYGGLENGLVNIINNLNSKDFHHSIISLTSVTSFQNRINCKEYEIIEINKKEGKDIRAFFRVYKAIRKINPDIVHTRNISAIDMLLPAKIAGVKNLIHSEHGLNLQEIHGKYLRYNLMRRMSNFIVKKFVVVSEDLFNWLNIELKIPKNKITLIYNGVDTNLFNHVRNQNIYSKYFGQNDLMIIGTIGRLEKVKNQTFLANAFVKLLKEYPQYKDMIRLVIVGNGNLKSEIKSILKNSGMLHLAWLSEFRDDVINFYQGFSIFVLPSIREGISNTILEAMACGLPVIACKVGGNPELVKENRTGYLIEVNNIDSLVNALLKYIQNNEIADTHGKNGRAFVVQNFSLDKMISKYDKLYREII